MCKNLVERDGISKSSRAHDGSNVISGIGIKAYLSSNAEDAEDKHEFQVNLHEDENIEVIPETGVYLQHLQQNDNEPEQMWLSYVDTGSNVGLCLQCKTRYTYTFIGNALQMRR